MKKSAFLIGLFVVVSLMAASPCFALKYELKTKTPEIQQALKNRHTRYKELHGLKLLGIVGENNHGYVSCLKKDPSAASLVAAENADREVIYRALVDQNSLGPNGMKDVEKAFADVRHERATPGEMIQSASGDWKAKA
jgi:uncharacterized protein